MVQNTSLPTMRCRGSSPSLRKVAVTRTTAANGAVAWKTAVSQELGPEKERFPPAATSPWNIQAVGPSTFLEELYADARSIVMERIRQQAADLDRSFAEQLAVLGKAVPWFVEVLRRDSQLIGD